MSLPPYIDEKDQVVLFDGVCKLCNGWSKFLIKHDRTFKFKLCSVQSEQGKAILAWFDMPTETFDTMLVIRGATAYKKSDAFLMVVSQLDSPWSYLYLLRYVKKSFRDWLYDRIALNRYTLFGKYDYCVLPSTQDKDRFLDNL